MGNSAADRSNVFEERIGKTVFFVCARPSDNAKKTMEEKIKNLMVKELLLKDRSFPA